MIKTLFGKIYFFIWGPSPKPVNLDCPKSPFSKLFSLNKTSPLCIIISTLTLISLTAPLKSILKVPFSSLSAYFAKFWFSIKVIVCFKV